MGRRTAIQLKRRNGVDDSGGWVLVRDDFFSEHSIGYNRGK